MCRKVQLNIRRVKKKIGKLMRSHLYVMKQIQNQMKYSTTSFLNVLFVNIDFPYLTAEQFSNIRISAM
jgi:hypothetical protein